METAEPFQSPAIYKDWIICRCPSCKGTCVTIFLPEEGPHHEELCDACNGVGIVKIKIDDLKQIHVADV